MAEAPLHLFIAGGFVLLLVGAWLLYLRRERRLFPSLLWAFPAMLVVGGAFALLAHPPTALELAGYAAALALGAVVGWQRGKLTHIWRDEEAGCLKQKASFEAVILLLAVVAVRWAIRRYTGAGVITPDHQGGLGALATHLLVALAVGVICGSRANLARRARHL